MRHSVGRQLIKVALLVFTVMLFAACTSNIDGSPVKGQGAAPPQGSIDVDKLDVGPYPTMPSAPLGVAGDPRRGVVIEAQRMANNVVGPWEVDSALRGSFGFGALVIDSAMTMTSIGPGELAAVADGHNFINGFASARVAENKKMLLNAVLRFPDEAAATAAATDMGTTSLQQQGVDGPAARLPVPNHPEAQANQYTTVDRSSAKWNAVRSFTAHGPYVLMQLGQSTEGLDPALTLVSKAIELQGEAIDGFRATDPSEFADISIDPTGLLERTLPLPQEEATAIKNATYETRGALHFQSDPVRSAKLFTETKMDLVAMARTNVYQTDDAEGAAGIVDGFYAEVEPTAKPANPVKNMPDSRCLQFEDGGFYCLAAADRYAIETSGPNLLDTQQQVAAQYVMLMSG
jgi:hypothetical protein